MENDMIMLTGATGAAGSLIAGEFVAQREPLRVLVRDRAKAKRLLDAPTVKVVEGDMAERSSLAAALEGVDRVLMISGPTMDMVETQCAFIDACKAAGVHHVIKFSGLDARPETRFPFGRMHKQIEGHLEASGLAWTELRPTGFMQEYLREAHSIVHQSALYLPLGDTKLSPVDLADVAKVGFQLLRDGGHDGARLAMTGPEALGMAEIAESISGAIGRAVRYVSVTPDQRRQALIAHGIPAVIAEALDEQVKERLNGGLESQVDLATHRLFDVKPTTFREFAERSAAAFAGGAAA